MSKSVEEAILQEAQHFVINCKDHGLYVNSEIEVKDGKISVRIEADNLPR